MAREATDPRSRSARNRRRQRKATQQKQKPVTRQQVLRQIREYDFEMCRMLGHRWSPPNGKRPIEIVNTAGKRGLVAFPVHCPQCDTNRIDYINPRTGHLEKRKYELPDGYLLKGLGEMRPSKDDWRREAVARILK